MGIYMYVYIYKQVATLRGKGLRLKAESKKIKLS